MYRKALVRIFLVNLMFLWAFISVSLTEKTGYMTQYGNLQQTYKVRRGVGVGVANVIASNERIVTVHKMEQETVFNINRDEIEILSKIVEAEAGGEDDEGKLLIANVILNRCVNHAFPDTIEGVVFQEENGVVQFSPIADGRYEKTIVSDETKRAVYRALEGEDLSEGALYFVAREYADKNKMEWFDQNLEFLFCHGGHEFFR